MASVCRTNMRFSGFTPPPGYPPQLLFEYPPTGCRSGPSPMRMSNWPQDGQAGPGLWAEVDQLRLWVPISRPHPLAPREAMGDHCVRLDHPADRPARIEGTLLAVHPPPRRAGSKTAFAAPRPRAHDSPPARGNTSAEIIPASQRYLCTEAEMLHVLGVDEHLEGTAGWAWQDDVV